MATSDARGARGAQGRRIAAHEVDPVHVRELGPGERVLTARPVALVDRGDRALPVGVEVGETAPLRQLAEGGFHPHVTGLQLLLGRVAERIVPQRGEEERRARQLGELDDGHRPSPGRLLPPLLGVDDLAGHRHALHPRELDPLHVTHHGDLHAGRTVPLGRKYP